MYSLLLNISKFKSLTMQLNYLKLEHILIGLSQMESKILKIYASDYNYHSGVNKCILLVRFRKFLKLIKSF